MKPYPICICINDHASGPFLRHRCLIHIANDESFQVYAGFINRFMRRGMWWKYSLHENRSQKLHNLFFSFCFHVLHYNSAILKNHFYFSIGAVFYFIVWFPTWFVRFYFEAFDILWWKVHSVYHTSNESGGHWLW